MSTDLPGKSFSGSTSGSPHEKHSILLSVAVSAPPPPPLPDSGGGGASLRYPHGSVVVGAGVVVVVVLTSGPLDVDVVDDADAVSLFWQMPS